MPLIGRDRIKEGFLSNPIKHRRCASYLILSNPIISNLPISQQIFFPQPTRAVAAGLTNGKRNRRTKQEQRLLADYALQEGGKACEAGLKRKTENWDCHVTSFLAMTILRMQNSKCRMQNWFFLPTTGFERSLKVWAEQAGVWYWWCATTTKGWIA